MGHRTQDPANTTRANLATQCVMHKETLWQRHQSPAVTSCPFSPNIIDATNVSGDTTTTAHLQAVVGPAAGLGAGSDVLLQLGRERGQVQVEVAGGAHHGRRPGQLALGVDEVLRRQQVAALVALVPPRVLNRRTEAISLGTQHASPQH